ncbi:hypothetical protein [Croceicoccus sediminis]|uniref:hypothetical protein n=1 Tax=Croceicoccus sediminis TaxID=2571150 RepID=UPI001183FF23|nr:hypothetical protein [Croceicoccus sediminis]
MKLRIALLCALAVSACDQPAEEPAVVDETPAAEATSVAPDQEIYDDAQPNAGNEYSYIDLLPLEPDDGSVIADITTGAGLCTFTVEDGPVILSVGAPLENEKAGAGVVRPNGVPAIVLYAFDDGADYLKNSPMLSRDGDAEFAGMTVTVVKAEDSDAATLTVDIGDGERDPYNGTWVCKA